MSWCVFCLTFVTFQHAFAAVLGSFDLKEGHAIAAVLFAPKKTDNDVEIVKIVDVSKKIWTIYKQVRRGMVHNYHNKLYESMPRRMKAVMEAQEGHTKY